MDRLQHMEDRPMFPCRFPRIEAAKEIPPKGETSLVTPESLTDAIKTFLEKTKWD